MDDAPAELRLLLAKAAPSRLTHIIDIGPNSEGAPPYDLLRKFGAAQVTGFASDPTEFAKLQAAKGPNETYFNQTISDGKTRKFHLYLRGAISSIYAPFLPGLKSVNLARNGQTRGTAMIETAALDDVPGLAPFDAMKIDAQGAEKFAFKGADRMLADAVCVIVELRYLRLHKGAPMSGSVDSALLRQGFALHKFIAQKSRMFLHSQSLRVKRRHMVDQLINGDAVYLRDISEPEKLSVDQIKHLAILACGVFSSHSLVIYLLDELVRRGAVAADLPARYVDALPEFLRKD